MNLGHNVSTRQPSRAISGMVHELVLVWRFFVLGWVVLEQGGDGATYWLCVCCIRVTLSLKFKTSCKFLEVRPISFYISMLTSFGKLTELTGKHSWVDPSARVLIQTRAWPLSVAGLVFTNAAGKARAVMKPSTSMLPLDAAPVGIN